MQTTYIYLTLPTGEAPITGKQITFEAPCSSEEAWTILIRGYATNYTIVDAVGNGLPPNAFAKGALVSVILNNESKSAFIQNPSTTKEIEAKISEGQYKVASAEPSDSAKPTKYELRLITRTEIYIPTVTELKITGFNRDKSYKDKLSDIWSIRFKTGSSTPNITFGSYAKVVWAGGNGPIFLPDTYYYLSFIPLVDSGTTSDGRLDGTVLGVWEGHKI